jgi:hypothetical protein
MLSVGKEMRLPVGKHVHLNGFDWRGFAMDHAPNAFRGISTEHRFAAVRTDGGGDLFYSYGSVINLKDLTHKFLTAFGCPAHMTVKHGYLRRE